jgi:hypothetical protein
LDIAPQARHRSLCSADSSQPEAAIAARHASPPEPSKSTLHAAGTQTPAEPVRRRDLRGAERRPAIATGPPRHAESTENLAARQRPSARPAPAGTVLRVASRGRRAQIAIARTTLIVALVVSITAVSYQGATQSAGADPAASGPTLIKAITTMRVDSTVPTILRPDPMRGVELASRSFAREALLGCDGVATGEGENGRLPASELCDLWQRPYQDRADAVVALDALNDSFKARFGTNMCLSSGYRDLEAQAALRARKGAIAAPAGQSNHGWGLAIDFCPSTYTGLPGRWLQAVGPVFGWSNPEWAQRRGSGSFEPWHWEFAAAVAEKDSQHGHS